MTLKEWNKMDEWNWFRFIFGALGVISIEAFKIFRTLKLKNPPCYDGRFWIYLIMMSGIGGILANLIHLEVYESKWLGAYVSGLCYDSILHQLYRSFRRSQNGLAPSGKSEERPLKGGYLKKQKNENSASRKLSFREFLSL
jgi:hypothetical protein